MSGSCLLNDLEGLPLGVRAEFRIQLRRKGVLMAHKRTDGVQGNVFACQPRAERMPQRVKNDFVPSVGDTVVEAERGYGIGEGVAQAALRYLISLSIRIWLIVPGAREYPKGSVLSSFALWTASVIRGSALKDSS